MEEAEVEAARVFSLEAAAERSGDATIVKL
jgi:hypothetical protein